MRHALGIAIVCFFLGASSSMANEFDGRYWAQDSEYLEEDIQEHDDLLDVPEETAPVGRQGHVQITMVPFGFSVYPIPSYGAQAAYFLTDDWGVEAVYGFGNADIFERQVKIEESSLRTFYLLPYELHVTTGIGMRNVRSEPLPSKSEGGQTSVTKAVASFAFGKSWLTETMVFALDLWGVSVPLRLIQVRGEDLRDTSDGSEETEDFVSMQHGNTYHVLRFRFGVEF